jgi:hypothetical protein
MPYGNTTAKQQSMGSKPPTIAACYSKQEIALHKPAAAAAVALLLLLLLPVLLLPLNPNWFTSVH